MKKTDRIIPISSETGMFRGTSTLVKPDGSLTRPIDTEVLPAFPTLGKTKMLALMPVLNWIANSRNLNLSKTRDRAEALRILKTSVIKN